MEPEIHEPRVFASIPPACLDGIDVDARAGIAEHEFLRSSILLEHHQFLKDDVVHGNRSSPSGLTLGDENCPSKKVHVFPLYTHPVPVYAFAYNSYRNSLTPLLIKVGIVGTNAYNVGTSAPNLGGDVSKSSQVRSTYFGMIQVWQRANAALARALGGES